MAEAHVTAGQRIIELLSQQVVLYGQLNELARKQSDLVHNGDPEMLLKILAGRQRLIDRVTSLDKELQPFRADWQGTLAGLTPPQQSRARELVEEVQTTLSDILVRDARDSEILKDQQQKVSFQIHTAAVGKKVHTAYGKPQSMMPSSRYFDVDSK